MACGKANCSCVKEKESGILADEVKGKVGAEVAYIFGLEITSGFYRTSWGPKTAVGLCDMVLEMAETIKTNPNRL